MKYVSRRITENQFLCQNKNHFSPCFLCLSRGEVRIKIFFFFLQGHFFGPVAVGFGVGLVGVYKEFPVATSIVSSRSSRQYSLSTFYQVQPIFTVSKICRGSQYAFFHYLPGTGSSSPLYVMLHLYFLQGTDSTLSPLPARNSQYSFVTNCQVQPVLHFTFCQVQSVLPRLCPRGVMWQNSTRMTETSPIKAY